MDFISLVTTDSRYYGRVDKDAFEDVKLTQLLPENVLSLMHNLPVKEDILLRQEVFRFMENSSVKDKLSSLLTDIKNISELYDAYDTARDIKEKQYIFCALLHSICAFYLSASQPMADKGLLSDFSSFFRLLTKKDGFEAMKNECNRVYSYYFRDFSVLIEENKLTVSKNTKQGYIESITKCAADMGISLRSCDYLTRRISPEMTGALSLIYPELWKELSALYGRYSSFLDRSIIKYADEIEFYLSIFELIQKTRSMGMPCCFARICDNSSVRIMSAYDITLISKECDNIIPNDVIFNEDDPFFFLSGANGGGKTTYLRTCGVAVLFSLLGCPVSAVSCELCMLDSIGTHFPRDERFDTDGRFLDEQKRVDALLSNIGNKSLVLLNETYSTTNEKKAAKMTVQLAKKLYADRQFGVYVTHQKSVLKEDIPLLSCIVDKDDENKRTYKIKRIDRIGSSHAEDVLRKYALTHKDLTERFGDLG